MEFTKVSITDGRRLILHYIDILFFHGYHLEIIPKDGWNQNRSCVSILILNQGCPMYNITQPR